MRSRAAPMVSNHLSLTEGIEVAGPGKGRLNGSRGADAFVDRPVRGVGIGWERRWPQPVTQFELHRACRFQTRPQAHQHPFARADLPGKARVLEARVASRASTSRGSSASSGKSIRRFSTVKTL